MSPGPSNVPETLEYRHLRNTALGYVTASSPTSTNPQYIGGGNILTSYKGFAERRPGHEQTLDSTAPMTGNIKRVFGWRRWASTFYIMLCEVTVTASNVYKLALGTDTSFQLIFSSASKEPFDFVVSNNFCFFGNGTDMRKFDGTIVTNWGISISSQNNITGPFAPVTAATVSFNPGDIPWSNPNNIKVQDGLFSTVTLNPGQYVQYLEATNFGFSIPLANTITGIQVEIKGFFTGTPGGDALLFSMAKGGFPAGFSNNIAVLPTSNGFVSYGGSSSLFGTTWTPNDINQTGFGVFLGGFGSGQSTPITFSIDFVRITIFSQGGPVTAVSGSAGTMSASNGGYQYVYCYINGTTGHVSSPTPASATTGNFTNKLNVGITVVASTDPQVTGIRLFRTTDGGGGQFF